MNFQFSAGIRKSRAVAAGSAMFKYFLNFLPVLCLPVSAIAADEQTPETTLPSMTVTVPRPGEDAALSDERDTTRLRQEDISIAYERSVDEVLRGLPGINISEGSTFGLGVIHARGVGGQGLIILDGMPIPDTVPGAVNLNALLPDGLEEITISRGFAPASSAFPSMGGSIRMISRDALDSGADLRAEGGTFGFLQETLRGDWAGERSRAAVTANRTDAFDGAHFADERQGNPERDPYHATQVMGKAGMSLGGHADWEGSMYFRGTSTGRDQLGMFNGALVVVDQPNEFMREEFWMAQNSLNTQPAANWRSKLQLGYTHNRSRAHPNGVQLNYSADLYLARWENDHILWQAGDDAVHLLWGAEGRHENAVSLRYDAFLRPAPPFDQERNQEAGFLDARFAYRDFSGDLGVRYEAYEQYKDQVLLHAGAVWKFTPGLRLRANAGNGFRIPSYNELLYPPFGNQSLVPERGIGGDLGFEWRPADTLTLSLTGFYNRYDELITLSWNPQPTAAIPCFGTCISNIPKSTVAGFEASGEWAVNAQWRGGAS